MMKGFFSFPFLIAVVVVMDEDFGVRLFSSPFTFHSVEKERKEK